MFKESDYSDNIQYCKYVWNKNNELNLGLESRREIQIIADMYVTELYHMGIDANEEYTENDILLVNLVSENIEFFREKDYSRIDEQLNERTRMDKMMNSKGGYGYSEEYDDYGMDERPRKR